MALKLFVDGVNVNEDPTMHALCWLQRLSQYWGPVPTTLRTFRACTVVSDPFPTTRVDAEYSVKV